MKKTLINFKMSVYPDLINYGYRIEAELGRNREGGRITWKGIDLASQQTVVIKQFCFATVGSNWSGYQAYEREISVLKKLDHPNIPQYINSIETQDGFCLIQEYIPAVAARDFRSLTLLEVKQIALKLLDILIYLQQQTPPILHRDLKPENILLDPDLNAYLIDFGFASLGSKEVAGSSVFKGTPGFIAPEQIIKPTTASDIYGLGVTLVCLLSDKNIVEIRALASEDNPYQLELKILLPNIEKQFRRWLEKMTHPQASRRFNDALSAKQALLKLDLPAQSSERIESIASDRQNVWLSPKIISGTVTISALSTVAVWGINFAAERLETTIINLAIAVLAAIVVGVSELGAAAIINWDRQAKLQGAILAIVIPSILVIVSGIIWGIQEAVAISCAIAVAETLIFSYYWWQIPSWKSGYLIKSGCWLSAIAFGITLGLKLI